MGLDVNGVKFLLHAHALGVDFTRTAMIGRQGLHLTADQLRKQLACFGHANAAARARELLMRCQGYAEELLRHLGGEDVDSFDYSDFEGSNCLHDFNLPLPEKWKNTYTVVLDGGSLEHVFHFPTAIKNCMEMLQVGGCFLGITPANNFLGHGFYQFSPELFYRIFDRAHGFEIRQLIACETHSHSRWYAVANPKTIGRRVTLTNTRPTYLLVLAQKVAERPLFAQTPNQSVYVHAWDGQIRAPGQHRQRRTRKKWLRRLFPERLTELLRFGWWLLCKPKFRRPLFEPLPCSQMQHSCSLLPQLRATVEQDDASGEIEVSDYALYSSGSE